MIYGARLAFQGTLTYIKWNISILFNSSKHKGLWVGPEIYYAEKFQLKS